MSFISVTVSAKALCLYQCMAWIISQAVENYFLILIACLWRVSKLWVIQKGEPRAFSAQSWACTYLELFRHLWKSHSQYIFSFKYFGQPIFCPSYYCCLRKLQCSTIATYTFFYATEFCVRWKKSPVRWYSLGDAIQVK